LDEAITGTSASAKMSNNGEANLKIGANKPAVPPSSATSVASAAARLDFPKSSTAPQSSEPVGLDDAQRLDLPRVKSAIRHGDSPTRRRANGTPQIGRGKIRDTPHEQARRILRLRAALRPCDKISAGFVNAHAPRRNDVAAGIRRSGEIRFAAGDEIGRFEHLQLGGSGVEFG
jgi:hypothetical protein